MPITLSIDDLLAYTDWQRRLWHEFLRQKGNDVLKTSAGANGDGRLSTVGEIIRHMFSAEKRYIERLSHRELTDYSNMPANDVDEIFRLGQQSRSELRAFIATLPEDELDTAEQHNILGHPIMLTPRKVLVHIVMHEIRHWAQLSTLLRLNGMAPGFHDFLFSPVFGEEIRTAKA